MTFFKHSLKLNALYFKYKNKNTKLQSLFILQFDVIEYRNKFSFINVILLK